MNNKGFAITGIIYTLFVLFLTILISVLSGLNSSQRLKIKFNESLENSYAGKVIDETHDKTILDTTKTSEIAPYFGKYVFEVTVTNGGGTSTYYCSTYLNKGTSFVDKKNIKFTTKDCNAYNYDDGVNDIELIRIYNFE